MKTIIFLLGMVGLVCSLITAVHRLGTGNYVDAAAWALLGFFVLGSSVHTAINW